MANIGSLTEHLSFLYLSKAVSIAEGKIPSFSSLLIIDFKRDASFEHKKGYCLIKHMVTIPNQQGIFFFCCNVHLEGVEATTNWEKYLYFSSAMCRLRRYLCLRFFTSSDSIYAF